MKKKGLIGFVCVLLVLCGLGSWYISYHYYTINSNMNNMISEICSEGLTSIHEIECHMEAMEDLSDDVITNKFINSDNERAYHILLNAYKQSMCTSKSFNAFNNGKFRTAYVEMKEQLVLQLDPAIKDIKKSDLCINGNNLSYGYYKLKGDLDDDSIINNIMNIAMTTYWIENSKAAIDSVKEYDPDAIIWSGMGYPYSHISCGLIAPAIDGGHSWLELMCTNGELAYTSNITGGYNMATTDIHKKYGLANSVIESFNNLFDDIITTALDRYGCINIDGYYLEYGDTFRSSELYDHFCNKINDTYDNSLDNIAFGYIETDNMNNINFKFIDSIIITKDSYTNYGSDAYDIESQSVSYRGIPIYANYEKIFNKLSY